MKIYVFNVTFNYDGEYIAKKFDTYDEALAELNGFLEEEVKMVVTECEYNPSVLKWDDDDVTLVYAEGYSTETTNMRYNTEDCAYLKIFELEI